MNEAIRELLGKAVRDEWVRCASEQPNPKPSHLVPWETLNEEEKEVDQRIGNAVVNAFISSLRSDVMPMVRNAYRCSLTMEEHEVLRHGKEIDTMTQVHQHSQQQIALGNALLLIDDEDFLRGFDNGYENCHTYHPKEEAVDTSTLLFLLRNSWNAGHSDQWMTGYIMGWLAAFYEQEEGQLALSTSVSAPCDREGGNL